MPLSMAVQLERLGGRIEHPILNSVPQPLFAVHGFFTTKDTKSTKGFVGAWDQIDSVCFFSASNERFLEGSLAVAETEILPIFTPVHCSPISLRELRVKDSWVYQNGLAGFSQSSCLLTDSGQVTAARQEPRNPCSLIPARRSPISLPRRTRRAQRVLL